jgi:sugar lactone lactonase YvrE
MMRRSAVLVVTFVMVLVVALASVTVPALGASPATPVVALTPRVLVTGAGSHGANGLAFDADDRLYVASVGGPSIMVLDPDTSDVITTYGADEGVTGPDDLTIGPDGSLYWTNLFTGEVGRRAPDGTLTSQMVARGVNPITFTDDGRLFVALDFLGDALYELDPDLTAPPRLLAEDLGFLTGFDWGPDGQLYGPIFTQDRVVRIDVDAQPPVITTVAVGFGLPAAAKFDSRGRLHVVDSQSGEVVRIDTKTGSKAVVATVVPGLDNLAFDGHDRLFVSSNDEGFVVEVLPDGSTGPVITGGMANPGGVAVMPRPDGGETVFVADMWTLRSYDGATGEERGVERGLTPLSVARDGERLITTSWFANLVQVWDPATQQAVESYDDFATPLNALRFQGDLVVAELGSGPGEARVVRALSGNPTARAVLADVAAGIQYPLGLAATEDELWVGDWATGTIWQLVADSRPLVEPKAIATGLAAPEGMAMTLDGELLVVETGLGRLTAIDLKTGMSRTVAEGLALGHHPPVGAPPSGLPSGVAVGASGTIFVTGDEDRVLYAIAG